MVLAQQKWMGLAVLRAAHELEQSTQTFVFAPQGHYHLPLALLYSQPAGREHECFHDTPGDRNMVLLMDTFQD